jgi:outer membrane protein assembly factor BamB
MRSFSQQVSLQRLMRVPGSCVLISLVAALSLPAQDWPQLLGPTRDGVYTGPFSTSVAPLWRKEIGEGYSAPVVAAGRLVLFHRRGSEEIVEILEAASGKPQWRFSYPTAYRDDFGFSNGPRSTPTIDSGRVYTYGAEGILHCLNQTTGAKIWSVDAVKQFGVRKEFFGTACSPIIAGGLLLMNIGGADQAGIVAIEKQSGKVAWKALQDEAGYSSPVLATIDGTPHALFFTRQGLVDADPASGRIRFQFRWRSRQNASVNAAVPLVRGNQVFLSASYGTGAALLEIRGNTSKVVWSGDDSLSNHYATSVHKDGYLYGFHGRQEYGQQLRCVEWSTGKVAWSVDGFGAGTLTLAGTQLFIVREDGELVIAEATPKGFQPARKIRLAHSSIRAYPAFSDGRIYVRTDNELFCFKIR